MPCKSDIFFGYLAGVVVAAAVVFVGIVFGDANAAVLVVAAGAVVVVIAAVLVAVVALVLGIVFVGVVVVTVVVVVVVVVVLRVVVMVVLFVVVVVVVVVVLVVVVVVVVVFLSCCCGCLLCSQPLFPDALPLAVGRGRRISSPKPFLATFFFGPQAVQDDNATSAASVEVGQRSVRDGDENLRRPEFDSMRLAWISSIR